MIQYKTMVGFNNMIQCNNICGRIDQYDTIQDHSRIEQYNTVQGHI